MKLWKGDQPKLGRAYSVTCGDHVGKLFIFIKKMDENYGFLSIPDMENHILPKKEFDMGLKNDILDYVEKVPSYVRKTVKAKFEENQQKMVGSSD